MPKPIVVVYVPKWMSAHAIAEFQSQLNKAGFMNEYWLFVLHDMTSDTPRFEVFYEKDFNPIKYNELKALIEIKLNENRKEDNGTGR